MSNLKKFKKKMNKMEKLKTKEEYNDKTIGYGTMKEEKSGKSLWRWN